MTAAQKFYEKAKPYAGPLGTDFPEAISNYAKVCKESKALVCESLLCFALNTKSKERKMAIIRNQLGDVTGGKNVKEALVLPQLCAAARDLCK